MSWVIGNAVGGTISASGLGSFYQHPPVGMKQFVNRALLYDNVPYGRGFVSNIKQENYAALTLMEHGGRQLEKDYVKLLKGWFI